MQLCYVLINIFAHSDRVSSLQFTESHWVFVLKQHHCSVSENMTYNSLKPRIRHGNLNHRIKQTNKTKTTTTTKNKQNTSHAPYRRVNNSVAHFFCICFFNSLLECIMASRTTENKNQTKHRQSLALQRTACVRQEKPYISCVQDTSLNIGLCNSLLVSVRILIRQNPNHAEREALLYSSRS